jgi:glycine/D-amino acid oxidase-like deaminating enzyme
MPAVDVERALRDASPTPFWLDTPNRPPARPPLEAATTCDLAVVGGGYAGLWTALLAKERDPGRHVVLLEGDRLAWAASGRNGGFCAASITHGSENGRSRWPDEYDVLEDLGQRNLDALESSIAAHGIDCSFERTGELTVATAAHQVPWLREAASADGLRFLGRDEIRAEVASPTYEAATFDPTTALVDPARLAWGLADACERLGVHLVEHTPVQRIDRRPGGGIELTTARGTVTARQVALATNAFPNLVRRRRLHTVPVYDHVLMTEPLSAEQLASIGWAGRQGIGDSANQFHYYRRTDDDRILWGGYDAVYHFGGRVDDRHDHRAATSKLLAEHFFATFPQLAGLRFTHRWGGAIDTCTRFCAFYGTSHGGDAAHALGFTGLGVGATRFAAEVMLDLLDRDETERTRTRMVQTTPIPFPPEPLAWIGITATRWSLDQADRNQGRRNLWLRTLDALGLGFDS